MSANPFLELGLSEKLVNSLSSLGFEEPTPIQTKAIPVLLEGRDVLGQAATGTGKTAAFSLPLIQRYCLDTEPGKPQVLILTPTRELCIQVSEAINSFARSSGVYVLPVYGGQDYSRQIKALSRGVQIVVATPGRALDHIRRGTLNLTEIKAVVLDEADEMLDMGFAEDLEAIFAALPEKRQTALFSATGGKSQRLPKTICMMPSISSFRKKKFRKENSRRLNSLPTSSDEITKPLHWAEFWILKVLDLPLFSHVHETKSMSLLNPSAAEATALSLSMAA